MYKFSRSAKLFMKVILMNKAPATQLTIIRLSNLKPNFPELSRQYNYDRRTVALSANKTTEFSELTLPVNHQAPCSQEVIIV